MLVLRLMFGISCHGVWIVCVCVCVCVCVSASVCVCMIARVCVCQFHIPSIFPSLLGKGGSTPWNNIVFVCVCLINKYEYYARLLDTKCIV